MKRTVTKFLLVLFASGLLFSITSCKKCLECTAFEAGTTFVYHYESQCYTGSGASSKINDFESEFRYEYAGYYIVCNAITN